jgi:tetratricopeptide (TPR) repeat protein
LNLRTLLLTSFLVCGPLLGDYQAGLDAYTAGDYTGALAAWREVAAQPAAAVNPAVYAETHYAVAMLYWQGQGVVRDYFEAKEWLLKAANLNHAGAQAKLGYLYTDGIAVAQDFDQAFEWFNKAARLGDVDGQYNLGIFYLNGWGTAQDKTMAKQYLAAASAQGDVAAEEALQSLLNMPEKTTGIRQLETGGDVTDAAPEVKSRAGHAVAAESTPAEQASDPALHKGKPVHILDESWILAQNPAHYTIQVIGLSSKERTERLIENFDHLAPLAIFTVQRSFKPIHILIQGSYPELDMARQQRDVFPSEINPPEQLLILKFGKIQALIESEGGSSG